MKISGVWLPVVTPFLDGRVDYESYETLVDTYCSRGIDGIIPLGTTGESPVLSEDESIEIIRRTVDVAGGRCPVFAGLSGNHTMSVVAKLEKYAATGIEGILSACPYYNRPGQEGLFRHYREIAGASELRVLIYNIPYRTGVNMSNETVVRLSELEAITGIKDSSGNMDQSLELILEKPDRFSVLTGEDLLFLTNLVHGGDGGILASSHFATERFAEIYQLMNDNNHQEAKKIWAELLPMIRLFFKEPNPGPIKYYLYRKGLIRSPEMRLPMTGISDKLRAEIDLIEKI